MQKQPSEGFFQKVVMRNFAEFTRKDMYEDPFLVFSCKFCEIYKITFFVEKHRTTASYYSSINSSEESTGKRNCELQDKN